jgi:ElaB/YqjD/DUF883 family membrane-anchored ribosome-binding protein
MTRANAGRTEIAPKPSAADRITDAIRHGAHLAHEARLMKSMARDAGEEGVHAAKCAIKRMRRGIETLEDVRDDAARYLKHQPFKAIGVAGSAGLLIGVAVGWIGARVGQQRSCDS